MTVSAAIDVGTTSVRSGVYGTDGSLLGLARHALGVSHPFDGAVEQDPDELVDAAVSTLDRALDLAGVDPADVESLGLTNQRATVVAWDASTGRALRPAIGWQDTRTTDRVAELSALGIPVNTSASCTKFEWLMQNDAGCIDAYLRGELRLGTIDSYLGAALSGNRIVVTDPSNAGATGLYAAGTCTWYDRAMELFGLDPACFVDIVDTDARPGVTDSSIVGAEMVLGARCGDQSASCAGHGMAAGDANLTLGTSAMLDVGVGTTPGSAPAGTHVLPLWRRSDVEHYIVEGSVQAAGATVEWLLRMGLLGSVERLDEAINGGVDGVEFVPALAGLGSPWNEPDARGLIAGLSLGSTPDDVVRAAMSGLAGRIAELIDVLEPAGVISVDGGLSQSAGFVQMIADASGAELSIADDPEMACRGAAMLSSGVQWSPPTGSVVGPMPTDRSAMRSRGDLLRRTSVELSRRTRT